METCAQNTFFAIFTHLVTFSSCHFFLLSLELSCGGFCYISLINLECSQRLRITLTAGFPDSISILFCLFFILSLQPYQRKRISTRFWALSCSFFSKEGFASFFPPFFNSLKFVRTILRWGKLFIFRGKYAFTYNATFTLMYENYSKVFCLQFRHLSDFEKW